MNETAKKLRDITQNAEVTTGSGKPYSVIATIKSAFGFDSILAPGVLLQFMAAIADEMDELQAEANDANNLRQKLDSAEKKAERRKRHIGYLETALHDKNALLEQRGGTIVRLTAECSGLRKQVPTERERQILAMWPRFEDGEYVWFGDEFLCRCGKSHVCDGVRVQNTGEKVIFAANHPHAIFLKDGSEYDERAKRPAPKVLDADGVEIHVGDTVWHCNGIASGVVTSIDAGSLMNTTRYVDESGNEFRDAARSLTHTRPDSWERLEEDAESIRQIIACNFGDFSPSDFKQSGDSLQDRVSGLVRRAKALAGAEAHR